MIYCQVQARIISHAASRDMHNYSRWYFFSTSRFASVIESLLKVGTTWFGILHTVSSMQFRKSQDRDLISNANSASSQRHPNQRSLQITAGAALHIPPQHVQEAPQIMSNTIPQCCHEYLRAEFFGRCILKAHLSGSDLHQWDKSSLQSTHGPHSLVKKCGTCWAAAWQSSIHGCWPCRASIHSRKPTQEIIIMKSYA